MPGYRLDYAKRSTKCKGPKPCTGTAINKGELRFASLVNISGNDSFLYRHWGCTTEKIISNVKNDFPNAEDVDGFEDLKPEDQERVRKAWEEGHVDPADVPPSARRADGEEAGSEPEEEAEESKKRKDAPAPAAARKRGRPPKKAKNGDEEEGQEEGEAEKPKSKSKKPTTPKGKAKKPASAQRTSGRKKATKSAANAAESDKDDDAAQHNGKEGSDLSEAEPSPKPVKKARGAAAGDKASPKKTKGATKKKAEAAAAAAGGEDK